ncbi:DUF4136 domain-containing protein [Alishewanella tabrizica]|nr:DUF4136 domain-containing protein [Alishewanella tabrizica]
MFTLLSAALLLTTACASNKKANIDYDSSVNFGQYQTFAFYQAPASLETTAAAPSTAATTAENAATDSSATAATDAAKPTYDPLLEQHFKTAITREMTALGYRFDEQAPQLLVNYSTVVENREDVRTSPIVVSAGYGIFSRNSALSIGLPVYGGVETTRYKVGTVMIEVIDAQANRVVWQGILEGRLTRSAMQNPAQSINQSVAQIYQRYPTRLSATSN